MTRRADAALARRACRRAGDDRIRLRLLVAYDGAGFHGFAAQPGQRTVAGALAGALATFAAPTPSTLVCAGRTDAGVHASARSSTSTCPTRLSTPMRLATGR